jgi:hypothetical protein
MPLAAVTTAAVLTLAASLLANHPVTVACSHPPWVPWTDGVYGYAGYRPDRIWLRDCRRTITFDRTYTSIFAHEIIHIEHPYWPHPKVYALEDWYAPIVERAIRKARARL